MKNQNLFHNRLDRLEGHLKKAKLILNSKDGTRKQFLEEIDKAVELSQELHDIVNRDK